MRTLACALLCALTCAPALAAEAVQVPLDATRLASLPRHRVEATIHERALHCEGVALVDVLRDAKAMPTTALRGADLARVAVVSARDGYRVAFSLGELDATLGNRAVYLVARCDCWCPMMRAPPVLPARSTRSAWRRSDDMVVDRSRGLARNLLLRRRRF